MEWTRDKTLALINEYKKRRGLWDMTHEDYRKKEMKQKLLLEVSASLGGGIPIVEIEKKFHTLRTQYHREINRMKRKEPYNSKWFGFKNLQFLSSPKAMRAGKGKLKAEITEDGVTKYIIRDASSRDSEVAGAVAAAASSITTEFLTIHRTKPTTTTTTTVTYEPTPPPAVPAPITIGRVQKYESTRARDLEKLIEETTKDVEEPEESKTKIIKEISIPLQHHSYSSASMTAQEESQSHSQSQHHHQQQQQQHQDHHMEEEHLSTIDIQTSIEDENIAYHHPAPARVFKLQRRDTCNEDDYYEEEQQQQHQQHPHIQSKRIYYENGNSGGGMNGGIAAVSPPGLTMAKLQPIQSPNRFRDEFATYGEYVANEMRTICNREILISLKHKINTALFEASMDELQQK